MRHRFTFGVLTWLAFGLVLVSCKIERLDRIETEDQPPSLPYVAPPQIPDLVTRSESDVEVETIVRQELAVLSAPELGGRRPGTAGAEWTEAHLVATYQELGLVPDGANRGWTQPVRVSAREIRRAALRVPAARPSQLDQRAPSTTPSPTVVTDSPSATAQDDRVDPSRDADSNKPSPDDVGSYHALPNEQLAIRRDVGMGPWERRLEIVDVGHGISLPRTGYDDYAGRKVAGKVVVVRDGWPAELTEQQRPDTDALRHQLEQALVHGAAGCIVAIDLAADDPAWETRRRDFVAPLMYRGQESRSPRESLEFSALAVDAAARRLLTLADGRAANRNDSEAATINVEIDTVVRTLTEHNVIGRIVGAEYPEQVVLLLAHWDAGGLGPPLPGGGGVLDNATGVAVLGAIASRVRRYVTEGRRPRRSLVVLATAAGSLDHAGAREYLESHLVRSEDLVAAINLESFRLGPTHLPLLVVDGDRSTIRGLVAPALHGAKDVAAETAWEHSPFLEAEVPALTLTRGAVSDTLEAAYDYSGSDPLGSLLEDAHVAFDVAWALADREETPRVLMASSISDSSRSAAARGTENGTTAPAEAPPPLTITDPRDTAAHPERRAATEGTATPTDPEPSVAPDQPAAPAPPSANAPPDDPEPATENPSLPAGDEPKPPVPPAVTPEPTDAPARASDDR